MADAAATAAEIAERRMAIDLLKTAPKFNMQECTWDVFYVAFKVALALNRVSEANYKLILFTCLTGEARVLATPDYDPTLATYAAMTGANYADALQELFEPAAETEQIRIEYEIRYQIPGEHPNLYFRDKVRLFMRAYSATMRNWMSFYDETITGLINQDMKRSLREFVPNPIDDHNQFREKLMFLATVTRRRLKAGEINHADALGAEAHASNVSYRANRTNYGFIKSEPINALGKGGNSNKGTCFHCGKADHFIAQCPRRASGLAPAAAAVQEDEEEESIEINGVHYVRRGSSRGGVKPRKPFVSWQRKPAKEAAHLRPAAASVPTSGNQRRYNPRVMYMYEDEEGQTHHVPMPDGLGDSSDEEQAGAEVNALPQQLEELQDDEFIPAAFLGM